MTSKKTNSELLDKIKFKPFLVTDKMVLLSKSVEQLGVEVIRLQLILAKLSELSESPDYGDHSFSLKMHPLVRIRALLRKIAFDNLK